MAIIVPTITAENPHVYREQIDRVQAFAQRIHIDLMDGIFTPNKSVLPGQVWWPKDLEADVHMMFQNPEEDIDALIALRPRMIIVHAECSADIAKIAKELNEVGIKCGIALLANTPVSKVANILPSVQQLLIFSGNLGHQGGSTANLLLLDKVKQVKEINPSIELAWDGGVNEDNAGKIINGGIEVVNVGGDVHSAAHPEEQYRKLQQIT